VHGEEGAAGPLQRLCEGDRLRLALVEEADLAKHGHREPVRKRGHHPEHPLAASSVGAQKGAVVARVGAPLRAAEVEVDSHHIGRPLREPRRRKQRRSVVAAKVCDQRAVSLRRAKLGRAVGRVGGKA